MSRSKLAIEYARRMPPLLLDTEYRLSTMGMASTRFGPLVGSWGISHIARTSHLLALRILMPKLVKVRRSSIAKPLFALALAHFRGVAALAQRGTLYADGVGKYCKSTAPGLAPLLERESRNRPSDV